MKKNLLSFICVAVLFFNGCSSILIRPAIDKCKKIAVVSVYMNRDLYNIKSPKALQGQDGFARLAKGLVKGALQEVIKKEDNELNQIVTFGVVAYAKQLRAIENWQIVSLKSVISNGTYKNIMNPASKGGFAKDTINFLRKGEEAYWVTPKGMHHIPISSVVRSGKRRYSGSAKDPTENARKTLAELCKVLGVDGVALVELDLGYRFGKVAKVTIMGKTSAKPSVSSSIVVVTSDGNIALNTGLIVKGGGDRYEGKSVGMVKNDRPFLSQKDNKIVDSFNVAIEKSAQGMKDKISKAFKKIK